MKLLIDIGNTSAKFALAEGEEIILSERVHEPWHTLLSRLQQSYTIERCVISNVAAEDQSLFAALRECSIPTLLLTDSTECALRSIPKGYGADRIAADLGALAKYSGRTILVVDAGTCITYDLIDSRGNVLSGVISPGIALRLKAMHEHTAALPLFEADPDTPLMGTDTRTSMMSSAIHGTRFEVEGYIRTLRSAYPDMAVCMTGGDAMLMAGDMPADTVCDPLLLFRGLNTL